MERDEKAEQRRECGILPLDLLVRVFRRPSKQNRCLLMHCLPPEFNGKTLLVELTYTFWLWDMKKSSWHCSKSFLPGG